MPFYILTPQRYITVYAALELAFLLPFTNVTLINLLVYNNLL